MFFLKGLNRKLLDRLELVENKSVGIKYAYQLIKVNNIISTCLEKKKTLEGSLASFTRLITSFYYTLASSSQKSISPKLVGNYCFKCIFSQGCSLFNLSFPLSLLRTCNHPKKSYILKNEMNVFIEQGYNLEWESENQIG